MNNANQGLKNVLTIRKLQLTKWDILKIKNHKFLNISIY